MSRELMPKLEGIKTALPADWATLAPEAAVALKVGICELLEGLGCCCNGTAKAQDSVRHVVMERAKALAVVKRLDSGLVELAKARGIDVDNASKAEIQAASTADEINSLIAMSAVITQPEIDDLVSDAEMAELQTAEIARKGGRPIRDPHWNKDLSQFVTRAAPHTIWQQNDSGIVSPVTVAIKLDTIQAEVDDNGEIMGWMYEESTVVI